MAKAPPSSAIQTPVMATKSSNKSAQLSKTSKPKQTTLLGFFQKPPVLSTPKRVPSRPQMPLTPHPSSDIGDGSSPIRGPIAPMDEEVNGLKTPVTPGSEKRPAEDDPMGDILSSRRVCAW